MQNEYVAPLCLIWFDFDSVRAAAASPSPAQASANKKEQVQSRACPRHGSSDILTRRMMRLPQSNGQVPCFPPWEIDLRQWMSSSRHPSAICVPPAHHPAALQAAFKLIDSNSDGRLSHAEMVRLSMGF